MLTSSSGNCQVADTHHNMFGLVPQVSLTVHTSSSGTIPGTIPDTFLLLPSMVIQRCLWSPDMTDMACYEYLLIAPLDFNCFEVLLSH